MYLIDEHQNRSRNILYDAGSNRWWDAEALLLNISAAAAQLASKDKALVFCLCRNDAATVVGYLAAVAAGHAVALLDARLSEQHLLSLLSLYKPLFVVASNSVADRMHVFLNGTYSQPTGARHELAIWCRNKPEPDDIREDLTLLLSTSGSTGSPKFVRLSRTNLTSNAVAISERLGIDRDDRAITSLPICSAYGLSVLNSHLVSGASVVLTDDNVVSRSFWDIFSRAECTSFSGVPYSYWLLQSCDLATLHVPRLKTMTQAGGKLQNNLVMRFHELMSRRGGRFYVMYGQTEATARMTILPPERLPEKLGSAGVAIAGGNLSIRPLDSSATGTRVTGEIIYGGPNVMMGYAHSKSDLCLGNLTGEILSTGDLGYLDDDGFLFVCGRIKRIAKLLGHRVNLDEVEEMLSFHGTTAVVEGNDRLIIYYQSSFADAAAIMKAELAQNLRLGHELLEFRRIENFPMLASGKIDYNRLKESSIAG